MVQDGFIHGILSTGLKAYPRKKTYGKENQWPAIRTRDIFVFFPMVCIIGEGNAFFFFARSVYI